MFSLATNKCTVEIFHIDLMYSEVFGFSVDLVGPVPTA